MRKVLLLKGAVLDTENEVIEHAGVRSGLVDMTELSLTPDGATRGVGGSMRGCTGGNLIIVFVELLLLDDKERGEGEVD